MSVLTIQNNMKNITNEIARINKDIATQQKKESDKMAEISRVKNSISKNTSQSTLNSKLRQIDNYTKEITTSKKKQAELTKKLSDAQIKLSNQQIALNKEEANEKKKLMDAQSSAITQQRKIITDLQSLLAQQKTTQENIVQQSKQYDFFISHASEDKISVAEPLANALVNRGAEVWFDKFTLAVGDSLRESIDSGLANSRYGIVILTNIYFKKFWTSKELNGLFSKWSGGEKKVILPVWHNISKDEVSQVSPILADILGLKTADFTIAELADELCKLL